MKEPDRLARNKERLGECFPPFAAQVRKVLDEMEGLGLRPRIQDGWRSKEAQLEAVRKGTSKVTFGFHNVVGAGGVKESLACDVLDDDAPFNPRRKHVMALAIGARRHGLHTGADFGLSGALAAGLDAAIRIGDVDADVKFGWDPTHIEPVGITIADAKNGARPSFSGSPSPPPAAQGPGGVHVVVAGDTLSGIAKQHGTTLTVLFRLNPKFATPPHVIRPGDKVILP